MSEADAGSAAWPTVSVVMPVRNEAKHLERAVASILSQDYPLPFDVCLAVAPSNDGTEGIAKRLAATKPRVSVVPNTAGVTPAGLNAAIAATSGQVVVRVDGHAELSPGYIRRAVETMRRTGAVNVGGVQDAIGETPFEEAVAVAMTSWLGTGGSRFHVGGAEGPVDTVYLGVFDREAGDAVGWFDESLLRNQDYELNIRLREAGGTVWFDPALRVSYRPRGSIRELATQYYEYGWWKAEVLRRYPDSLRARQAIPAVAPVALVASALGARRRPKLLAVPVAYAAAIVVGSTVVGRQKQVRPSHLARILPTMQLSWGAGALRSTTSSWYDRALSRLHGHPELAPDQARWDGYGTAARDRIRKRPSRYRVTKWPHAYATALERLLDQTELEGKRVLDLGCGLGELSVWLAQRGAETEGIDLGPNLVEAAGDVADLNQVDVDFHVGDIADLPFEDARFDLVIGMSILHHLSERDVQRAAREAHRVLVPGGRLIVFEPIEDSRAFDLLQNLVPRHRPGDTYYRPSILNRTAWHQWIASQDDRPMTRREFRAIGQGFSTSSLHYSGLTVRLAPMIRKPGAYERMLAWDDTTLEKYRLLQRFARNIVADYTK